MLTALMLVSILSATGCPSVEKKPTPESLVKTKFETILEEGCQPVPNEPKWVCNEDAFIEAGELGIRLQEAVLNFQDEQAYYDKKLSLTEDFYQAQLDEWHRKWYIMLPLGVLGGVALALTISLAM